MKTKSEFLPQSHSRVNGNTKLSFLVWETFLLLVWMEETSAFLKTPLSAYVQSKTPSVLEVVEVLPTDNTWGFSEANSTFCSAPTECEGFLGQNCKILQMKGFNFTIPDGTFVARIVVTFSRRSSISQTTQDISVKLLKGGATVGQDYASSTFWTNYWDSATYPSRDTQDPLWQGYWTPEDTNSYGFGVALQAGFFEILGGDYTQSLISAYVKCVQIDLYYYYICETLNNCNENGRCSSNETCECSPGWTLDNCSLPLCSPMCVNGICNGPQLCVCNEGWSGDQCEQQNVPKLIGAAYSVLWAGIIISVSIASILFGVAISTAYYIARKKFFKDDVSEIELAVVPNYKIQTVQQNKPRPAVARADWKQVKGSKQWHL